jgi:hypothetical protein
MKSLEKELLELSKKVTYLQAPDINTVTYQQVNTAKHDDKQQVHEELTCQTTVNQEHLSFQTCIHENKPTNDLNNDTSYEESIQSEEIMRLIEDIEQDSDDVDKLNNNENIENNVVNDFITIVDVKKEDNMETDTNNTEEVVDIQVDNQHNSNTDLMNTTDEEVVDLKVVPRNNLKTDLMKKTNEELKSLLKSSGKNTKGTKTELVKRLLEL